jgi:hypothetical protein
MAEGHSLHPTVFAVMTAPQQESPPALSSTLAPASALLVVATPDQLAHCDHSSQPTHKVAKLCIKKVILKLSKLTVSLEGGMIRENTPKSTASSTPSEDIATTKPVSYKTSGSSINKDPQSDVTQITPNIVECMPKVHAPNTSSAPLFNFLLENPPTLPEIISYGNPSSDIHVSVMNQYQEDPLFSKILDNPGSFRNFEVSNGRIYMWNKGKCTLRIPDIKLKDRRI